MFPFLSGYSVLWWLSGVKGRTLARANVTRSRTKTVWLLGRDRTLGGLATCSGFPGQSEHRKRHPAGHLLGLRGLTLGPSTETRRTPSCPGLLIPGRRPAPGTGLLQRTKVTELSRKPSAATLCADNRPGPGRALTAKWFYSRAHMRYVRFSDTVLRK